MIVAKTLRMVRSYFVTLTGIQPKTDKCFFMKKRVKLLGHKVSDLGVETDSEKIAKVKS